MANWRILASLMIVLTAARSAPAQTYTLSETPLVGSYHDVKLSLSLNGTLKLLQEGKEILLKESATATHGYVERLLAAGPEGTAGKSARIYKDARVSIFVEKDKLERSLRPERAFLVAQRGRDGVLIYCPKGPLTREELDVTDHFDTLGITGILPSKNVAVGDTWKLGNATVQSVCHLQGLSEHSLTARLDRVQEYLAIFTINGSASGTDLGAAVTATVSATCRFDTKLNRLVSVEWTQKDERQAGPANPASVLEMTVKLTRTLVEPVNELSDVALVPVPGGQPPRDMTDLLFKDAKARFELQHARDWQLVGKTDAHIVWRLMDRGEFIAQVSVAPWKKAEPGKHMTPDEIKSIVANSPGWGQETLIKAEEVKLPSGQWAYLVAGEGDLDGVRAVQYFYVVASPAGEQAILTFSMTPAQTQKLGSRDLEFVQGFVLPGG
jgi:hypothetical protein